MHCEKNLIAPSVKSSNEKNRPRFYSEIFLQFFNMWRFPSESRDRLSFPGVQKISSKHLIVFETFTPKLSHIKRDSLYWVL